jgi:hypothetical protein
LTARRYDRIPTRVSSGEMKDSKGMPDAQGRCSLPINIKQDQEAVERRERRIDEALKETFPASETCFVGAGAPALTVTDGKVDKPDLDRVNIHKSDELRGWCAYWSCTPAELKEAVQDVGVMAANVDAQLAAKGHKRK